MLLLEVARFLRKRDYLIQDERKREVMYKTDTTSSVVNYVRSDGLVVARPLRKLKVAGSTPAGIDRFSGSENRRHGWHIIWHVKDPSSINLALVLWIKLNHGNIGIRQELELKIN
ncbi:hypothetical protein TNCV_2543151 [Trichonephila clavipes]|nr:hypothetical protein TNCV_2543151 [Trichonephila clavipes]